MIGHPQRRLRRPTVGEIRGLLELWEALRNEIWDTEKVIAKSDPPRHPLREGKTTLDQHQLGARWVSSVIHVLNDDAVEPDDLASWTTTGSAIFSAFSNHWFEVPLAFGGSLPGSDPSDPEPVPTPPISTPPLPQEPLIYRQAILGQPAPG